MDDETIIEKTAAYVRAELSGEATGHDWWHSRRVWRNALAIGRQEEVDLFVVQLAALLHDIADWKFHECDTSAGPEKARRWLASLSVEPRVISHVTEIIATISFKGAAEADQVRSREAMVVQDADRLDALGAIGIARTFAYGAHAGQEIYNPQIAPAKGQTFAEYSQQRGTTINHFYEKLLLLQNRMHTESARALAESRHQFMLDFLKQFFAEWAGER